MLVDGDNVSADYAACIRAYAGAARVVRVYGNAAHNTRWHTVEGYRFIHAGTGKNASDMLLGIDAMELALREGFERIVIASSDGDFTHLATRLRELGVTVIGMGEEKAPESFRAACCQFQRMGAPASSQTPKTVPVARPAAARPSALDHDIRDMIKLHSVKGQGMKVAALSSQMFKIHDTRISSHPEKTWRSYLAARGNLYDLDARGPDAMVRFKPGGFAASP